MIRLDTLKIGISTDALRDFDSKAYHIYNKEDDERNVLATWRRLKTVSEIENGLERKLGITSISIDDSNVKIEISAKVLKENYIDLINKDNIEQVLDNINSTGLIDIDKGVAIDTAKVYKCDVTCNLPVTKSTDVYLRDISILGTKRKYEPKPYRTGIVLSHRGGTVNERLILYDKISDLEKKDKWNKELLKHINVDDFRKKRFRVESNYVNYEIMRKYFDFPKHIRDIITHRKKMKGNIYLSDILLNKSNPNYKIFNNMLSAEPDIIGGLLLDILDSDEKFYKIEKQIGRAQIIKYCDYDIVNIRRFISSKIKYSSTVSKYLGEYEKLLKKIKVSELSNYNNIDEVRGLLKVA